MKILRRQPSHGVRAVPSRQLRLFHWLRHLGRCVRRGHHPNARPHLRRGCRVGPRAPRARGPAGRLGAARRVLFVVEALGRCRANWNKSGAALWLPEQLLGLTSLPVPQALRRVLFHSSSVGVTLLHQAVKARC